VQVKIAAGYDSSNHFPSIKKQLAGLGYGGSVVLKKDSDKELDLGNAIFYKDAEFESLSRRNISYSSVLAKATKEFGPASKKYFCYGRQVAVFLALRQKSSGKIFIIGTTHIACSYEWKSKQVAQVQVMLNELQDFKTFVEAKFTDGAAVPIIMTGDFNSTPDSGVYELVTRGRLMVHSADAIPNDVPANESVQFPFACASDLGLSSAYRTVLGSEPEATNVTGDFSGTLDYIFTNGLATPMAVLATPSDAECSVSGGLPDAVQPSDHLPIAAQFVLV